ncbi:MAG: molecular chaperone TorD family protein [Acidobacteria bacterium]|nr:molecular chaperone TorD family protein [Acidobacteriota bacterium]
MLDLQPAAVDDALARSVIYRTLSVGFQMPTDERLHQIGARDRFPVLVAALHRLDEGTGRPLLSAAAARLRAVSVPSVEVLAGAFVRLFGHTARGLVCASEAEYGPDTGFHQPQQLADISGYYLAFGLRPVAASDVRLDHIACECEFMDFLNRKQAVLIATGSAAPDEDTLQVTREAERTFLREHLGRFGRAFAARVASEDADGFFGALAQVLRGFIEAECARVGVVAGPIDLIVPPDTPDETPMLCGTAGELIQIQRSR